jgi:hypothetical protein
MIPDNEGGYKRQANEIEMAAMIRKIATTISSSIREKPGCFSIKGGFFPIQKSLFQ